MKNKLLILLAVIPSIMSIGHSTEEHYFAPYASKNTGFKPSPEPIFNSERPKPNIHMVLDDSYSMLYYEDIMMPEHYIDFGLPVCQRQSEEWHNDRKRLGEYDPFIDGKYMPWDESKAIDGLIHGKKRPPKITNCHIGKRSDALNYAIETILRSYVNSAYVGVSFLWQVTDSWEVDNDDKIIYRDKPLGLIRLPIKDYSGLSENEFQAQVLNPISKIINKSPGNTPLYPAVYEVIKMFRGQPVNAQGVIRPDEKDDHVPNKRFWPGARQECQGSSCYYTYVRHETPLRYRCQQNHMIVMSDGVANRYRSYGIDTSDDIKLVGGVSSIDLLDPSGINLSARSEDIKDDVIGKITGSTDLRYAYKPVLDKAGNWVQKNVDDAGKRWDDEFSVKMPIYTHSVSLFVNPLSQTYLNMTESTNGMNLGFNKGEGNAEDLLKAFDTIFSSIIKTSSSTLAVTDRKNANALEGPPKIEGGFVDMSTIGAIRYDTAYNFRQHTGRLRAMAPYVSEYIIVPGNPKKVPVIETMELWDTDDTIVSNSGRYLTIGLKDKQGEEFRYLDDPETLKEFSRRYDLSNNGQQFNSDFIDWLINFDRIETSNTLRNRLKPMGSITNSNIVLANKDELYVNVAKERMTQDLSAELIDYLKFKAKYQPANLLIVSDNDGFINFINAQRGFSGVERPGERNTAYFPQLLAYRLDEIAKSNRPATLVLEGKTNLTDAKVYQPNEGRIFATIGMTGMGAGGKGLVGYRLFAGTEGDVASQSSIYVGKNNPIDKVIPLYEITNEGPKQYRTKGFEDLGYTYSGFEFFNQMEDKKWKSIAVFGNGYGVEKSVLYFINAYTGEKLHEIVLNNQGGGASTPSIVVKKNPNESGQIIERLYVGDYTGNLYRVDFENGDFDNDEKTTITLLFSAATKPNNAGQSAITVKPLVTYDNTTKYYTVAFGTGIAESKELDRGDNSLVEHSIYSIVDKNNDSKSVRASSVKAGMKLYPVLYLTDLAEGSVHYAKGESIDHLETAVHDLDLKAPTAKNSDGWYIRLIADGTYTGERTLQNPKYDPNNNSVVFNTWGIYERPGFYEVNGLPDPCLLDTAFGKTLSLDIRTGAANNSSDVANKGVTNNAYGGVTGTGLSESPVGNSTTNLDDLDKATRDEILNALPEKDSSYAIPKDSVPVMCKGDISSDVTCAEHIIEKKKLQKGRINFQKIKGR